MAQLGQLGQVQTIIRRLTTPLLQVGDLGFDAEVSVGRTQAVEFTERRIAAGVSLIDHSFALPRTFQIQGAVSGLAQLQNLGRPGQKLLQGALDLALTQLEAISGFNFQTRVEDFEKRLQALVLRREEVELISKVVGRIRVIILSVDAMTTAEEGDMAIFRLSMREVQRSGLSIAQAIAEAMALTGTGGAPAPGGGGASTTTPGSMAVVP